MSSNNNEPQNPMGQPAPQGGPGPYPPQPQQPYQGAYPGPQQPYQQQPYQGAYPGQQQPQKSFLTTWLLALLLGVLGVDRFYLGKIGTGILKLITFGGAGIWYLVDLILLLAGKQTDKARRPLEGYDRHKKVALIVTIAVLLLSMIFNITTGPFSGSGEPAKTRVSSADHTPKATAPSAAAAPVEAPEPEPTPEPTPEPDPATPTQTFTGTGDDIVTADLGGRPAIVTFSCDLCTRNVVLKTNGRDSLLVNTIGAYSGKHLVDTSSGSVTNEFEITAVGDWALTVEDVTTITPTSGPATGTGDSVVLLTGSTTKAAISYVGERNFVVQVFGDRTDLAVNTIGSYEGTVRLEAPAFVQVKSSGTWTITPQ